MVEVCADANLQVNELNEANNCDTGTYTAPDLMVSIDSISSSQVVFTVTNSGTSSSAAGPSVAEVTVDSVSAGTVAVSALAVGASEQHMIGINPANGDMVEVCADARNDVDELNENNNCDDTKVMLPDLRVTIDAITIADITFTVRNHGLANASSNYVSVTVNGTPSSTVTTGLLGPGGIRQHVVAIAPDQGDVIEVCADTTNQVTEFHENNNCGSETFVTPDLVAVIDVTTDSDVTFTITNVGLTEAGASIAEISVNSISAGTVAISTLAAGANAQHIFSIVLNTGDVVEICADSTDNVAEFNENNNCSTAVMAGPDLTVQIDNFTDTMIQFTVTNTGSASAGTHVAEATVNGVTAGTVAVSALEGGAGEQHVLTINANDGDTIQVCTDALEEIPESNESNNCDSTVFEYKADLILSPSAMQVNNGDCFDVDVFIHSGTRTGAAQCSITFDPTVVQIDTSNNGGFETGSYYQDWAAGNGAGVMNMPVGTVDNINGYVSTNGIFLMGGPTGQGPMGSGTLMTYHFCAIGAGNADITLEPAGEQKVKDASNGFDVSPLDLGEGDEGNVIVSDPTADLTVTIKGWRSGNFTQFNVTNIGSSPTTACFAEVTVNGLSAGTQAIPALEAGATYWDGSIAISASDGDDVAVCADSLNQVAESNEVNNCDSMSYLSTNSMILDPSETTVSLGDKFDVRVQIETRAMTGAAQCAITFDPSVVQIDTSNNGGFENGAFYDDWANTHGCSTMNLPVAVVDNVAGNVGVNGIFLVTPPDNQGPVGQGSFMTYHFEAVAEGNANINLVTDESKVIDTISGSQLLPFSLGDGTEGHVTVLDSSSWDPCIYDTNDNGKIGYAEMVDALLDYLTGEINYGRMVDVLLAYLTDQFICI